MTVNVKGTSTSSAFKVTSLKPLHNLKFHELFRYSYEEINTATTKRYGIASAGVWIPCLAVKVKVLQRASVRNASG